MEKSGYVTAKRDNLLVIRESQTQAMALVISRQRLATKNNTRVMRSATIVLKIL
jgi:hypothetical protein